jgi:hypothetical protein
MARPRTTKKYGRSIYSPKKGRRYSKKQLYKYYGGNPPETTEEEEKDETQVNSLVDEPSSVSLPVASEKTNLEVNGDGDVAPDLLQKDGEEKDGEEKDGEEKDGEEKDDELATEGIQEASEQKTPAEPKEGEGSKFMDVVKNSADLAVQSLNREIYGEPENDEKKQIQDDSINRVENNNGSGIEDVQDELKEIKSKVDNIIIQYNEEFKTENRELKEENKRLNNELLTVYRNNSNIVKPDSMTNEFNASNDSSLDNSASLGNSQGESMDEQQFQPGSMDGQPVPPVPTVQPGSIDDSQQQFQTESMDGQPVPPVLPESMDGQPVPPVPPVQSESMNGQPVPPVPPVQPGSMDGQPVPTVEPESMDDSEQGSLNQKQLSDETKQETYGGAKSKRRRRTIRKSKKGHKYKYRYVY